MSRFDARLHEKSNNGTLTHREKLRSQTQKKHQLKGEENMEKVAGPNNPYFLGF